MVLVLSSNALSSTGRSGSSLSTSSAAGGVSIGAGSSCINEMSVSCDPRRLPEGASASMMTWTFQVIVDGRQEGEALGR